MDAAPNDLTPHDTVVKSDSRVRTRSITRSSRKASQPVAPGGTTPSAHPRGARCRRGMKRRVARLFTSSSARRAASGRFLASIYGVLQFLHQLTFARDALSPRTIKVLLRELSHGHLHAIGLAVVAAV